MIQETEQATVCSWLTFPNTQSDSPTISRMVTGCVKVAGRLFPAILIAITRKKSFSPVGSPLAVKPQRSTSSVLAGIHSSAEKEGGV